MRREGTRTALLLFAGLVIALMLVVLRAEDDAPAAGPGADGSASGAETAGADLLEGATYEEGGPELEGAPVPADALARAKPVIRGRVVERNSRKGVPGVRVLAGKGDDILDAMTDATGAFEITAVTPGDWSLFPWHPEYAVAALSSASANGAAAWPWRVAVSGDGNAAPSITLEVYRGREINGLVLAPDGTPASGARIHYRLEHFDVDLLEWLPPALEYSLFDLEIRADARGRFSLACFPTALQEVRLGATRPGMVSLWSMPRKLNDREEAADVTIQLVAAARVSGTARLASGEPAVGLDVSVDFGGFDSGALLDWMWGEEGSATTDEEGRYELRGLPPESTVLAADWTSPEWPGGTCDVEGLKPGEHRTGIDFEVPRRFVLEGRLQDAGGASLAGEPLQIRGSGDEPLLDPGTGEPVRELAQTEEDGTFRIAVGVPGPFNVVHERVETVNDVLQRNVLLPSDLLLLTSTATPRTTLQLLVLGPDGEPVPRFRSVVWMEEDGPEDNAFRFRSSVYGEAGVAHHEVAGTPPLSVKVQPRGPQHDWPSPLGELRTVIKTIPLDGIVKITLGVEGEIRGRVVDVQGRRVPGTEVRLVWMSTRDATVHRSQPLLALDEEGRFRHRMRPPASGYAAWIRIKAPDGYIQPTDYIPDPERGERLTTLRAGRPLRGRVLSAEPLRPFMEGFKPSVAIQWRQGDDWKTRHAPIAEDGSWRVTGVPEGTDLRLSIARPTTAFNGYRPLASLEGVRAGDGPITLRLDPGETISGRLISAEAGVPAGRHIVTCGPRGAWGQDNGSFSAVSPDDGSFQLRGLVEGAHDVVVRNRDTGVVVDKRRARAGEPQIEIRLPTVGEIQLVIDDRDDVHEISYWVWAHGTHERVASGVRFRVLPHTLAGLPTSGAYDIVLSDYEGHVGVVSNVRVGARAKLKLVEGVGLSGTLLRGGKPAVEQDGNLYARQSGACFELSIEDDGTFDTYDYLLPGTYDLHYVAPDGSEQIVARGVEAGADDVRAVLR